MHGDGTGEPERPGGLESEVGFRISRAHRRLRAAWESRIADLGLTSAQATILRATGEQPGTGLRELARRLHADPMNVKRLADSLEQAGLLRSASDPRDRRRRVLLPTALGHAVGGELAARALAWNQRLGSLLDPDGAAALYALLDRLEAGIAAEAGTRSTGDRRPVPAPVVAR